MNDALGLTIFLVIFGLVACFFIGLGVYNLIRFFKGVIKIELTNQTIYYNDILEGTAQVKAKVKIMAEKVVVAVVGEEYVRSGKSGHWEEVYRQETILSNRKNFNPGTDTPYPFKIKGPELTPRKELSSDNPILSGIYTVVSSLSRFGQRKIRWSIQVRVYAPGVDLFGKKYIQVYEKNQATSIMN